MCQSNNCGDVNRDYLKKTTKENAITSLIAKYYLLDKQNNSNPLSSCNT